MAYRPLVFTTLVFLFTFGSSALAFDESADSVVQYYVATVGTAPIAPETPTHILIAGVGDALGTLFQEAAAGQAHRMRDLFPSDQIVLIFMNEGPVEDNEALLRRWGLTVVARSAEELTLERLMSELVGYRRIRSIDIYAHSWTHYARLTKKHNLEAGDGLRALFGNFTDDAYAIFHGCSAGWRLAADVARLWGIPVAGALAGTNFERLHSIGDFYFNDADKQPPGPWALDNAFSFSYRRRCRESGCLRMKPDNRPYSGEHGRMTSGLPFYKFFCPADALDPIRCSRGMAMSVYTRIDLSALKDGDRNARYKAAVQNLLCPIDRASAVREDCRKELVRAENTRETEYSPFEGSTAVCDWEGCRAPWIWEKPRAFVEEYFHYLKAYDLIANRIPTGLEP